MKNQLSRVVDARPGLVWVGLLDGHIDFLNQRWCEYPVFSADEAHGPEWQTAMHPEDLRGLLKRWRTILASREQGEAEA